jgi:HK97 family phage major capsid protein
MTPVTSLPPGTQWARLARTSAVCRADLLAMERYAESKGYTAVQLACKALVNPIDTAAVADALAPFNIDLGAVLRPLTVLGRMTSVRRAPFRTRILVQNVGGSGAWVGENRPVPVTAAGISQDATLEPLKVGAIRVMTAELMRNAVAGSDALIAADAASSLVEALDRALVDPANGGDAETPASIASGAPTFSSSGSSVAQIDADLERMVQSLVSAEMSLATATWIMSPVTATSLALKRGTGGAPAYPLISAKGGSLLGLPVITSTACSASGSPNERFLLLAEQSEILLADDNGGDIALATDASLQLNDAPGDGAQQQISLWQNNLVGIKTVRYVNWRRRRTGAVAVLRDIVF